MKSSSGPADLQARWFAMWMVENAGGHWCPLEGDSYE
jgi:hypothetical protein